jgi:hypothetical protein
VDDRPFVGNRRELACSFSIGLIKLLDLDAGSRDDLAPLGDISRYDRSEFFRRITDHVDALFLELVGHFTRTQNAHDLAIQLVYHRFRCASRCEQPIPAD